MSAYDLVNNIKVVNAINAAAITDDSSESSAIDTAGFESVTVVAQMAAFTSGAGKIQILEGETSAGSFTAVADEDLINVPEKWQKLVLLVKLAIVATSSLSKSRL